MPTDKGTSADDAAQEPDGSGGTDPRPAGIVTATLEDAQYPRDEFDVDVVPGQRRGAHRAAAPPLLAMLPWLLVGLFVVACIVTLITFVGGLGRPDAAPTKSATATATASATPTTEAPPPAPEIDKGVRLLVLNGTRTVRTSQVERRLTSDGWIVERASNNSDRNVAVTLVVYRTPDLAPTAEALVAFLGAGTAVQDPNLGEDMRVIIGKDYNAPETASPTSS